MSKIAMRYIVNDVDEAIEFYTELLGFSVQMHPAPGFAALEKDDLQLYLNAPGAGGAGHAMPDGTTPKAGGWNRFQLVVEDLESVVDELKQQEAHFRNEIVNGKGGKQILLEDPSGNPIELFEPHEKR
jgi:catechol 2,3-dioxygenase-like lactoylglutathione lyase family enzyme